MHRLPAQGISQPVEVTQIGSPMIGLGYADIAMAACGYLDIKRANPDATEWDESGAGMLSDPAFTVTPMGS